jgi:dephospho-CoA kinase
MIRAGLTGGFASGKSFVSRVLEELGCHVVRADELGHQVLQPGGEAFAPVIDKFGAQILDAAGRIDRKRLAAEVFDSPELLAQLNAIVHPAVIRKEEEFLHRVEAADPCAIGIIEAAILIESGSYKRFDRLILVVCTPEQQLERAMKRGGYTRSEVLARLSRQLPVEEKRRFADYVIDTSGTEEETVEQTKAVYRSLRSLER